MLAFNVQVSQAICCFSLGPTPKTYSHHDGESWGLLSILSDGRLCILVSVFFRRACCGHTCSLQIWYNVADELLAATTSTPSLSPFARAERVAKWCERRRKTRPNLPFFEVSGRFPRLWICCKSLEQHDAFDVLPNCIEMIAEMLAINLEYIEKRQEDSLSVSAETWKQSKRIQNMSLRQAMETKKSSAQLASKQYVTELLVHIQETCSVSTSTFLRDKMWESSYLNDFISHDWQTRGGGDEFWMIFFTWLACFVPISGWFSARWLEDRRWSQDRLLNNWMISCLLIWDWRIWIFVAWLVDRQDGEVCFALGDPSVGMPCVCSIGDRCDCTYDYIIF